VSANVHNIWHIYTIGNLQGSVVTQTMLDGQLYILQLPISYGVYVPMAGSRQSYCKNKQSYFLAHPVQRHICFTNV